MRHLCVSQVIDQGYCQSSWAFSAAGAIDGQFFVMTGDLMEISIQQLLDCSSSCGNRGCHGGIPTWAYRYIEGASGICTTTKYPYLGYVSLECLQILAIFSIILLPTDMVLC